MTPDRLQALHAEAEACFSLEPVPVEAQELLDLLAALEAAEAEAHTLRARLARARLALWEVAGNPPGALADRAWMELRAALADEEGEGEG